MARPPSAIGGIHRHHRGMQLARHRHRQGHIGGLVQPGGEGAIDGGAQIGVAQYRRHVGAERRACGGVGTLYAAILAEHDQRIGETLNHRSIRAAKLLDQGGAPGHATAKSLKICSETLQARQLRAALRNRFVGGNPSDGVRQHRQVTTPARCEQHRGNQCRGDGRQRWTRRNLLHQCQHDQSSDWDPSDHGRRSQHARGYLLDSTRWWRARMPRSIAALTKGSRCSSVRTKSSISRVRCLAT